MTVTSAHGVLLDADAADYTLRALRLLVGTLPKVGSQPKPKLLAFITELERKTQAPPCGSVTVDGAVHGSTSRSAQDEHHAVIGTAAAARILGVSSSAVTPIEASRSGVRTRCNTGRARYWALNVPPGGGYMTRQPSSHSPNPAQRNGVNRGW